MSLKPLSGPFPPKHFGDSPLLDWTLFTSKGLVIYEINLNNARAEILRGQLDVSHITSSQGVNLF